MEFVTGFVNNETTRFVAAGWLIAAVEIAVVEIVAVEIAVIALLVAASIVPVTSAMFPTLLKNLSTHCRGAEPL